MISSLPLYCFANFLNFEYLAIPPKHIVSQPTFLLYRIFKVISLYLLCNPTNSRYFTSSHLQNSLSSIELIRFLLIIVNPLLSNSILKSMTKESIDKYIPTKHTIIRNKYHHKLIVEPSTIKIMSAKLPTSNELDIARKRSIEEYDNMVEDLSAFFSFICQYIIIKSKRISDSLQRSFKCFIGCFCHFFCLIINCFFDRRRSCFSTSTFDTLFYFFF